MNKKKVVLLVLLASLVSLVQAQSDSLRSIVDEVIWEVGCRSDASAE